MTHPDRQLRVDAANLASLIERAGAAIALAEEPSSFAAALELGADPEGDGRE